MSYKFKPDWNLLPHELLAVRLSISLNKHVPDWPGATDEQIANIVTDLISNSDTSTGPNDSFVKQLIQQNHNFATKQRETPLMCIICGKSKNEVENLVAGQFGQICYDCARTAASIAETESNAM